MTSSCYPLSPSPFPQLGSTRGYLSPMAQGENVVTNMEKHDNNRLPLRAVSVHVFRTSIKDNEIMETALNGCMLAEVLTEK